MPDPYEVLSVTLSDPDEVIRRHYLDAVRRFSPERHPKEFGRVKEAYERIRNEECRLKFLLFELSQGESITELLEEERCRKSTKRMGLSNLMELLNEASRPPQAR